MSRLLSRSVCALLVFFAVEMAHAAEAPAFPTQEGDYVARDFRFRSGETLAELKLHYTTLGKPQRDTKGA